MGIKEEIAKIAVEQGYDGARPKSIAQAIDALTDTLAGEDVKSGRSVVGAVKALAPYIGSGGGGGSLGVGHTITGANGKMVQACATRPDDMLTAQSSIAFIGDSMGFSALPAGVYVYVEAASNSRVLAEGDVIDSEIVEIEQDDGTTLYVVCFVMPDADVIIE